MEHSKNVDVSISLDQIGDAEMSVMQHSDMCRAEYG